MNKVNSSSFLKNGVTAHRGNSQEYPENSMAAFESARQLGVDWIELDIHRSKDGKLVVIHDPDTRRVGDVALTVMEASYEQLREVDAAYRFRKEKGLTLAQCPKTRVPLLSEVVEWIKGQNRARISIQPKASVVQEACALVKEMGAEAWVGFNDTALEKMVEVKRLAPSIPVFYDRWRSNLAEDIQKARAYGFETMVLYYREMTADKVVALHQAGLEAGVWTLNDPEMMEKNLDMGIDRIYTDVPQMLLEIRKTRQGIR